MKNIPGSSRGPHSEHDLPCQSITTTLGVIFAAVNIYSFLHRLCGHTVILNKHFWWEMAAALFIFTPNHKDSCGLKPRPGAFESHIHLVSVHLRSWDRWHLSPRQALEVTVLFSNQLSKTHFFKKKLCDPISILWIVLCLMQTASATRGLGMDRITVKTDRISCLSWRNIPEGVFPG